MAWTDLRAEIDELFFENSHRVLEMQLALATHVADFRARRTEYMRIYRHLHPEYRKRQAAATKIRRKTRPESAEAQARSVAKYRASEHGREKRNATQRAYEARQKLLGPKTFCTVPDCSGGAHAKGLCNKHYLRNLKTLKDQIPQ